MGRLLRGNESVLPSTTTGKGGEPGDVDNGGAFFPNNGFDEDLLAIDLVGQEVEVETSGVSSESVVQTTTAVRTRST